MSLRTIGPTTTAGEAYVSVSTGNRAGVDEVTAGLALPPQAAYEGDTAEQVFERRCGCSGRHSAVLQLGMPQITRRNHHYLYGAEPGALGTALAKAGHRTAVVANADQEFGTVIDALHREAALAMARRSDHPRERRRACPCGPARRAPPRGGPCCRRRAGPARADPPPRAA